MSNKKENQKSNNEIKYFSSAHTETGFLNSLELIESEHGSDYYAIKFAARRGNSNKPSSASHSVRVNGKQAKEVITQIADKVNAQLEANKKLWDAEKGKEALTILITLNISDTIAKSYMNKHTGKEVNYIDGRCTSIAYVRIGDEVIFQKEVVKAETTEGTQEVEVVVDDAEALGITETEKTQVTGTDATNVEQVQDVTDTPKVDVATGELAKEVTLDPTTKDFQERKVQLKEQGYTWDADKKVWSL